MKTAPSRLARAALALACLAISVPCVQAAPEISAKQAVALAEEALAPKNASGAVFIQSVALQRTSIVTGKKVWTVTWSDNLPGSKPGSLEVGLEIGMDGSVVHLIKGRGTSKPQALPH